MEYYEYFDEIYDVTGAQESTGLTRASKKLIKNANGAGDERAAKFRTAATFGAELALRYDGPTGTGMVIDAAKNAAPSIKAIKEVGVKRALKGEARHIRRSTLHAYNKSRHGVDRQVRNFNNVARSGAKKSLNAFRAASDVTAHGIKSLRSRSKV